MWDNFLTRDDFHVPDKLHVPFSGENELYSALIQTRLISDEVAYLLVKE